MIVILKKSNHNKSFKANLFYVLALYVTNNRFH
jgi:hypothetical protein